MPVPIALLMPLIPSLIKTLVDLVQAVKQSPETSEEVKAHLDALELRLEETMRSVEALKIY